jgi:adenylate cyclase
MSSLGTGDTALADPASATEARATAATNKFQGRLFRKYAALFVAVVCVSLLAESGIEGWFGYREHRQALLRLQREQAQTAAVKTEDFIQSIVSQLRWTTQLRWAGNTIDQRRLDAFRLLHQVPAITELSQVDPTGHEQLRVSRLAMDVVGSNTDFSHEEKFTEAIKQGAYYGPVYFHRGSEPYMTIAVPGARRDGGVTIAEVNLKFIWDLVSQIKVGEHGYAYVVDKTGRLVAHPNISLVLRNVDLSTLAQVRAAQRDDAGTLLGQVSTNMQGHSVLSAYAPIHPLRWHMFVELPRAEAFAPLYASIKRSLLLLALGLCLAIITAVLMARKMVIPIRTLQAGVSRVAEGELGHQVDVRTGDEIEALADQFNAMSVELREGKAREERIGRLRRFLTAQLANVIESSGSEALLKSHRREVTVVFCDLRGFTAFAESTEPHEVMGVLQEYHQSLGALINKYEGTLERFIGDGLMILFNDPIECPEPSLRAVRMAIEMRECVAALASKWREKGYNLGFGVGMAHGKATLGQIGFEGRLDYSAIGRTPNLAARLCSEARDGQILIDPAVQEAVAGSIAYEAVGELQLKGIKLPLKTANVLRAT